jgi:hypothetical protein
MPSGESVQRLIHILEVGAGARYLRYAALAVIIFALAFLYDIRAYRNFSTQEAMDAAQLARNISEGKGYTTQFVRPFSLYLVQSHNAAKMPGALSNTNSDLARIKTAHPDLANPPVYPVFLAGLMKILPFHHAINLKSSFWANNESFWRYEPDFLIAVINEILLLVVAALTFFLAKNLFDSSVAWLAAALVLGCELFWKFSASGLSTILLLVIFLALTRLLLAIEKKSRETKPPAGKLLGLAVAAGILTGIGALTRYAFGWAIIPVVLFLIFFSGPKRISNALAAFLAFAIILTPWIVRNEIVSGTAFGTAGYALIENTYIFPQFQLERSTHPDLSKASWQFAPYVQKLLSGVRGSLASDLFKTGGWEGVLFFAGLFLSFRNTGARRIRYFLLMCLGVFIVVQSLGRTQLSEMSPEINSENLLVLLAPLIFIFGASFFFTLLEQMTLPLPQLRYVIIGFFVVLCCSSMIFVLLSPKTSPLVYPPYYPPEIQQVSGYMKPNELMMSDVPWAVAWYGDRQCAWLTLNWQDEFSAIDKNLKPVQALYLTPQTMDGKFISDWMEGGERSWGSFIMQVLNEKRLPDKFPLTHAPAGLFPERMFLTDRDRWSVAQ